MKRTGEGKMKKESSSASRQPPRDERLDIVVESGLDSMLGRFFDNELGRKAE